MTAVAVFRWQRMGLPVVDGDLTVVRHGEQGGDRVVEFPNVARPSVAFESREQALREGDIGEAEPARITTSKRIGEGSDISDPVAKRWNLELDDRQPEKEVFPEAVCPDRLTKVAVRTRNDTRIDRARGGGPYRLNLTGLQGAQQDRLHRRGELSDLVEDQSAPVGAGKVTGTIAVGAGKGAFRGAE